MFEESEETLEVLEVEEAVKMRAIVRGIIERRMGMCGAKMQARSCM